MLKKYVLFFLLVCLSAQSLWATSNTEDINKVIAALRVDTALLRLKIQDYEKTLTSLSQIIDDLERSNQEIGKLSTEDRLLLASSKQRLEKVTTLWTESKSDLARSKLYLLSLETKIKTWRTIGIVTGTVAILEAFILYVKLD